jgi:hypothetical protein
MVVSFQKRSHALMITVTYVPEQLLPMSPVYTRIRKEWRLQVPQFIIRRDQTSRLGAGPLLKSSFITILVAMRVLPAKMCLLAYAILKERSGMEFDARGKRRRETFLLHPFCHERRLAPFGCP